MKLFKLLFASLWSAIPLSVFYAIACATATFIENDYGTAVAKALIYNTWWFDFLHAYLLITLVGCLISYKTWRRKKYASFLFHLSLIVIILGAGIMRYFGFEGKMRIREGEQSNFIYSNEAYLNIIAQKGNYQENLHIPANLIAGKTFKKIDHIFSTPVKINVKEITKLSSHKNDMTSEMTLSLDFNGEEKEIKLIGGIGVEGEPKTVQFGDEKLLLWWGVRKIALPFSILLKDFQLERYAGSMSPSSYASDVEVIDNQNKLNKPFRIYMNHTLDYDGYRFFQDSYDTDELGTILSVNHDPGKNMTYLGYLLLILGSICLVFDSNGRFRRLGRFLQSQKILSFFFIASMSFYPLVAQDKEIIKINALKDKSKIFVQHFNDLLVQDTGGRIKPINTIATDVIHKITKTDNLLGLSNTQLFLGMMMMPEEFQNLKMIFIDNPELKKLLGKKGNEKYVSFQEVFTPDRIYILQNYVEEANRKKPALRSDFDKKVIDLDGRINLAFMIYHTIYNPLDYSDGFFRIFPDAKGGNLWNQPFQAIQFALFQNQKEDRQKISQMMKDYVHGFHLGLEKNDWSQALMALDAIKNYQRQLSPSLIPSNSKIKAEIFLNQNNVFKYLILPYILSGVIFFGIILFYILCNKTMPSLSRHIFYCILGILSLLMTLGLILRWYVSGHAPWSNAYESMLYVSWTSSFVALLFFRKSGLAISASLFLAGISLFVANLGFMDPQIGNLVPVLKSYWLNIHVSVITASYGFLGLCFVLGLITLLMFILRAPNRPQIDQTILSLTAINEIAMILGVLMLTVGNFLGGVWANESWGRYWGWDAKETWALISIIVYAMILHLRFLGFKNMPYVLALSSSVGFSSILMTYFGVNYYLSGMHSYAAGDPVPVPSYLYVIVLVVIALIILASFKRKLVFPALKK